MERRGVAKRKMTIQLDVCLLFRGYSQYSGDAVVGHAFSLSEPDVIAPFPL
jgi:hypothetical protein